MKFPYFIIMFTILPASAAYKGGYEWWLDKDCTPATKIEWIVPAGMTFETKCPTKNVFLTVLACTYNFGDTATVYSKFTESEAINMDAGGISLYEHEYYHTQCYVHAVKYF